MRNRALALVLIVGCGGGGAKEPQPGPAPAGACESRWLTLEDDAVDLALVPDGVVWVQWEHGRIVAASRNGEQRELRPAAAAFEDIGQLAVTGGRVVWPTGDGTVWILAPGATEPVRLGAVGGPTMIASRDEEVVVSAQDGIHHFTLAGEPQQLLAGEVWVMKLAGDAVYAQRGGQIVRVPLDGRDVETLAESSPSVTSMLFHDGRLLVTAKPGVFEVAGGTVKPFAPLAMPALIWNLREAGGHIYFSAGNVVYVIRDGQPVPIAIAPDMIGDLEVEGDTVYVATREYNGVRAICHDPDGPPVALATPVLACGPGETETERDALSIDCADAAGERAYSIAYHASGTRFSEYARDGRLRSWYADGTLRSEEPRPNLAGPVRRYFANGALSEEGQVDAEWAKHGAWKTYHPDGAPGESSTWEHGQRR